MIISKFISRRPFKQYLIIKILLLINRREATVIINVKTSPLSFVGTFFIDNLRKIKFIQLRLSSDVRER